MDKIETNRLILRRFIGRYHKRALACFCQGYEWVEQKWAGERTK
ncbi:hypothetical protein ACP2WC_08460 [Bacillus altitudinis]